MALRKVSITEVVMTTYEVEIDAPDQGGAENMAVDLLTNNADDEEFMESITAEERLVSRTIISVEV